MLAIKLQRVGKKHQPSYRLVVAEKKSKMAGPPVEDLGTYNPFTKAAVFSKERILHWVKMGAKPTVTVHNLLVGQGIVSAPKTAVKMRKKAAPEEAAPAPTLAPAVEAKKATTAVEAPAASATSAAA